MPRIINQAQTLTTVGSNVTIEVSYSGVFSPVERFLVANGLRFQEQIHVIGEDTAAATTRILFTFLPRDISSLVTPGTTELTVPITPPARRTVTRALLQEDVGSEFPGLPDRGNDEIRCRIEITPIGLPAFVSTLTRVETLLGELL